MPRAILYTRADGGVSVVTPSAALIMEFVWWGRATGTLQWVGPPQAEAHVGDVGDRMTLAKAEAAALDFVRTKDVPDDAQDVRVVDDADLPDRRFRDAWRRAGPALPAVAMPLARLQRMAEIRRARDRRLAASDGPMLRAMELAPPETVAALKAYRQALRDVPQRADLGALATPEALAAFEPAWPEMPR